MKKIITQGLQIAVIKNNDEEYISLFLNSLLMIGMQFQLLLEVIFRLMFPNRHRRRDRLKKVWYLKQLSLNGSPPKSSKALP